MVSILSKVELLSFEQHKALRVKSGVDLVFGDIGPMASVVADELPKLALDFPVFITKNPNTGEFELTALMGFSENENLFVEDKQWRANYIPMDMRRQPFQALIIKNSNANQEGDEETVKIGINVHSNRLTESGNTLFNDDGSNTDYLNDVSNILGALMTGQRLTKVFLNILAEYDLIESVKLNIQLKEQKNIAFDGLYTVHSEKLMELADAEVVKFHKHGYLQACHAMMHSIGHVEKLIAWRAQRLLQK